MHYAFVVEGDGSNQGRYEGAFGEHIGVVYGFVLWCKGTSVGRGRDDGGGTTAVLFLFLFLPG